MHDKRTTQGNRAPCNGKWMNTDDNKNNKNNYNINNNNDDVVYAVRGLEPCDYLWASQLHL